MSNFPPNDPQQLNPMIEYRTAQYEQEGFNFLKYWGVIRKQLVGIIGLVIAVGILALLVANSMTPIYTATTMVSIERVALATGRNTGVIDFYSLRTYAGTQNEIIKSTSVAERVVDELKLWEHPWFYSQKKPASFSWQGLLLLIKPEKPTVPVERETDQIEALKKSLIGMVRGGLRVQPIRDTYIVKVSFSSASPEIAALVVNGVVEAFAEQKLESRLYEIQKVSEWMNESLGGISGQLRSSEDKIIQFSSSENLVGINERGATSSLKTRLDDLSNEITRERLRYNELRVLKRQATRFQGMDIEELLQNPTIYKHPTLNEIKTSEIQAQRQVDELKKRYGPKHPKMRQATVELDSIKSGYREQIPNIIRGIEEDYEVSRQKLISLETQYNNVKKQLQDVSEKDFELERLQRDIKSNRNLYDVFVEQSKQINLSSTFETDRVRVIETAVVPSAPSRPDKRRIVIMSMLMTALIGIGLAFLVEYLDQTIKTSEDVETKLNLPILGQLPLMRKRDIEKGVIQPERLYVDDEKSSYAESVRTIRTGLTLSAIDSPHKVILVTSSVPGEGKTSVACNTALSFSQLEKTLIFDADLRRPSTKKILGYEHNTLGMSDLLTGNAEFEEVIHKVEGTGLHVITAGTIPPDPLDLLASRKFKKLLETLSNRYDRIVIDSPPISLVSDPVLLASLVDAVVFVVKADDTNTRLIESSLNKLKQANAHIIGAVLNAVNMKKVSKYYGNYGKYYRDGYYSYEEKA